MRKYILLSIFSFVYALQSHGAAEASAAATDDHRGEAVAGSRGACFLDAYDPLRIDDKNVFHVMAPFKYFSELGEYVFLSSVEDIAESSRATLATQVGRLVNLLAEGPSKPTYVPDGKDVNHEDTWTRHTVSEEDKLIAAVLHQIISFKDDSKEGKPKAYVTYPKIEYGVWQYLSPTLLGVDVDTIADTDFSTVNPKAVAAIDLWVLLTAVQQGISIEAPEDHPVFPYYPPVKRLAREIPADARPSGKPEHIAEIFRGLVAAYKAATAAI